MPVNVINAMEDDDAEYSEGEEQELNPLYPPKRAKLNEVASTDRSSQIGKDGASR